MENNTLIKKTLSCASAAALAEFLVLPISVIKLNYQSGFDTYSKCINDIYYKYGILGFYRTSLLSSVKHFIGSSYRLTMYNMIPKRNNREIFLAGLLSSLTCVVIIHPLEYLISNLLVNNKLLINNVFNGITFNILKGCVGGMTYLPLRTVLKNNFPDKSSWVIGAISAVISNTLLHPLDYFKNYLISNYKGSPVPYSTPYRGLFVSTIRIVPHFVLMTEMSEYFMKNIAS